MEQQGRTFVIGDIHGELGALETLLARLPELGEHDTLVFLGDYVDRGRESAGVIRRVRALVENGPAKVIALRGNHEDIWLECCEEPNPGYLIPRGNGCLETFRSFTGRPHPEQDVLDPAELSEMMNVPAWFPPDVRAWMASLPLFYEDEFGIYVHAGLEGEGEAWKHPSECAPKPLMWMREPAFFRNYRGKRLVFGHTRVTDLPLDHLGPVSKLFDDPKDIWVRGDLIGIDTGSGKGGFLSAVELPRLLVYESR